MKSVFALLLAPLLLAPVYYQGGTAPTVGEAATPGKLTDLPTAAPLTSPLLLTPTLTDEPTPTIPAQPEPQPQPIPAKPRVMDAPACLRGLGVMQDMAALAYQRQPNGTYMAVLVAAGLAKQQLMDGALPNLHVLRNRLHALPWRGTLRDQLLQTYVLLELPCTPAQNAGKITEKPAVARPR